MKPPNFFVLGGQKCGSTWVADMLGQHPDVYMHPNEIHYFDKTDRLRKGNDWYLEHFRHANSALRVGEKTPDYLWAGGVGAENHNPNVHKDLVSAFPEAKFVAVLRDPVDRAASALLHMIRKRRLPLTRPLDKLFSPEHTAQLSKYGILEKGLYAQQLERYQKLIPAENLKVLIFEDCVKQQPSETLRDLCQFLGLDTAFEFQDIRRRSNPTPSSFSAVSRIANGAYSAKYIWSLLFQRGTVELSDHTLRNILDYYRQPNQELFVLLGRSIPSWRN